MEGLRRNDESCAGTEAVADARGEHKRAEPRASMFLNATIFCLASGESHPLRVRNISAGGLMADCRHEFAKGDRVELELRGVGKQAGSVAWAGHGKLGVSFDDPINPLLTRRPVKRHAGSPRLPETENARRPGLRIR